MDYCKVMERSGTQTDSIVAGGMKERQRNDCITSSTTRYHYKIRFSLEMSSPTEHSCRKSNCSVASSSWPERNQGQRYRG